MESNINNKNQSNIMKRIFAFTILFMLLTITSYGAVLSDDISNPSLVSELDDLNLKNVNYFLWLTFTNLTFDITGGRNYAVDTKIVYFVYNNNNVDIPFITQIVYKDEEDNTQATYKELDIPADSLVTFLAEPTRDGEYMSVYMRCLGEEVNESGFNSSTCGAGYQVREYTYVEVESGVNSIFSPLINLIIDLIEINMAIWKIAYYIIVVIVIVGALGGSIMVIWKYYDWAQEYRMFKKRSNTRR